MPNDLDELMSRIDESIKSLQPANPIDLDAIIAYHRNQRAKRARGEKTPKSPVDLTAITQRLSMRAPDPEPIKRRSF